MAVSDLCGETSDPEGETASCRYSRKLCLKEGRLEVQGLGNGLRPDQTGL